MANQVAPEQCPQCGGDMWDNSRSKRNPRQPDYVCKDAECVNDKGQRSALWISDTMREARASVDQQPRQGAQRKTPPVLDSMLYRCAIAARDNIAKNCTVPSGWTDVGVAMLATALFAERVKGGLLKAEENALRAAQQQRKPAPPPPPPPPPQRRPEPEFEDFPGALDDPDDDLPF